MPDGRKPRLLNLCCGVGGCTKGYQDSGFYVVGVDIEPQPNYCGDEFVQDDAVALMSTYPWWDVEPFDAIHAGPPCLRWSPQTAISGDPSSHPDLITPLRPYLIRSGLPYVIENVPEARGVMIDPVQICGSSLGLKVRRHRLFETNWPLIVPPCAHGQQGQPVGVYGEGSSKGQKRGRKADNEAEVLDVMQMPWADRRGATQAVPPAYTELIGHQLVTYLRNREREAA